jgi:hypothetical protein
LAFVDSIMNKATFLVLLIFLTWGCGELGVATDIARTTEVNFEIARNSVNRSDENLVQSRESTNFASDTFSEYLEETQRFVIERLYLELSDYEGEDQEPIKVNINIEVIIEDEQMELFDMDNVTVKNTGRILLFDEDRNDNMLSQDQIAVLEKISSSAMMQKQADFLLRVDFSGPISSDFVVGLYFDMVAEVELR